MFAKTKRLSRQQFTNFFSVGRRAHSEVATIITAPSPAVLVSIVVGKKVSKKAVVRNRIKRQAYATLYSWCQTNQITAGVYIIILKPAAGTMTRRTRAAAIQESLAQLSKTR